MLLCGAAGMAISQFIIAIVGTVSTEDSQSANNVLIAFVCIFIGFYASTFGPIGWVVVGEIFPLKTRAKSIAISLASNWIWNWGIAYATPYMVDEGPNNANLGSKVFFIWGGFNLFSVFFTYFYIYETKGLSLEQIDELYEDVNVAWKSRTFVPSSHTFRRDKTDLIRYSEKGEDTVEIENVESATNV